MQSRNLVKWYGVFLFFFLLLLLWNLDTGALDGHSECTPKFTLRRQQMAIGFMIFNSNDTDVYVC